MGWSLPASSSSFFTSMPHSRITFRYLPASRILCFHGCRNAGMHAPPGSRFVPCRGFGAAPRLGAFAPCTFDEDASELPSRSVYRRSQYSSV